MSPVRVPHDGSIAPDEGRSATGIVWALGALVVVVLLVFSGRYGYHRDELYFIEAGERLAWGYVDQPPLTPLIARLAGVFDHALPALRFLPAISAGILVVIAAAFARLFGGDAFAQVLAAVATASAGFYLAVGHLLSTTTFDVLTWVAALYLVARIVQTGSDRLWLVVGAVVGIGLLNKWTVLFVVGASVLGMLVTHRGAWLRSPFLWAGAATALVVWMPNLIWQWQNDWPFFAMAEALHAEGVDEGNTWLFLPLQALLIGPIALPLWLAGLRSLFLDQSMRSYRFIGWAYVVLLVTFVVLSSKPYFIAPLYVPLFGAGAVATERFLRADRRWLNKKVVLGAVLVGGLVALPISLPLLAPGALAETPFNEMNQELGETYGWDSFVDRVAAAYHSLPEDERADAVILTLNYGEAGAIDLLGPQMDLPSANSGHNNYWLWGPPDGAPVVIVGYFSPDVLRKHFVGLRRVGAVSNEAGLDNDESGAPIWIANEPRRSWPGVWPALRHYN